MTHFPPNRTDALHRLARFVPHAARDYAARRNYDLGPGAHQHVSTLSPYLRTRLVTEEEVLAAVLGRHAASSAEKFVQEVFWRTYWKGWLELRPGVWADYQTQVRRAVDDLQTQGGLRQRWEAACAGDTGIACFDAWARELAQTGYLHNHARMWFASIWVFTLDLPWVLGADFFLRHLLDGDPASNTLGWRWVAGLQTRGKTYAARPDNIAKYTDGRFDPTGQLAREAPALSPAGPDPEPRALPTGQTPPDPGLRTGFILHTDDLSPAFILDRGIAPVATLPVDAASTQSPLHPAPHRAAFHHAALQDVTTRWAERLGDVAPVAGDAQAVADWAAGAGIDQIVMAHAPVGPNADLLARMADHPDMPPVTAVRRDFDSRAWPHATKGFFPFKKHIPDLLAAAGL
ncbi:FAD-binding domain-containing protein [Sulfitobacter sabulilitoris]|uniref:FAD-binding domain-containing protein n=1 Tax=Sulfitobacter sabulilitoris TaxID=2562655 RepID=UPI00319E2A2D